MQDAAQFLLGTHDFSTFCSLNSETPFRSPVKTILQADIQPSSGFLSHHYEYRWEPRYSAEELPWSASACSVRKAAFQCCAENWPSPLAALPSQPQQGSVLGTVWEGYFFPSPSDLREKDEQGWGQGSWPSCSYSKAGCQKPMYGVWHSNYCVMLKISTARGWDFYFLSCLCLSFA